MQYADSNDDVYVFWAPVRPTIWREQKRNEAVTVDLLDTTGRPIEHIWLVAFGSDGWCIDTLKINGDTIKGEAHPAPSAVRLQRQGQA